jgi:Flp pilus assembly protein TadG
VKKDQGQALVELAIALPVILLALLFTFYLLEVGREKLIMTKVASLAARVAVINPASAKQVAKDYLQQTNLSTAGKVSVNFVRSFTGGQIKTTVVYTPASGRLFGFSLTPKISKAFTGPHWQNGIFFDF